MKLWISLLLIGALLANVAHTADHHADHDDEAVVTNAEDEIAAAADAAGSDIDTDLYASPELAAGAAAHFHEHFDDATGANARWIRSASKKAPAESDSDADAEIAQYDGVWSVEAPQRPLFRDDLGLVLKSKAKHAAIAAPLVRPFRFTDGRPLVVQYEVQLQDGQTCGGSYVKLLSEPATGAAAAAGQLAQFNDKTPYTIMFGPDKCGNEVKLHFIFRHVNPLTGAIEEKHCRKSKERLEEPFKDKQPHLYTLIVRPDNTYTIKVDHRVVNEGSLLADFTPAVNPEREIDDAADRKPTDWDEREKIADPAAVRPVDWDEEAPAQIVDATATKPVGWLDDEEELVADPAAVKPADWDTEMDGEWEPPLIENEVCAKAVGCGLWQAPMVANPAYKGKWHAPLIDNPNYRGKWAPRRIANPAWFEDLEPFRMKAISAVGFELWSMSGDILFDNILIADSEELAEQWAAQGYDLKRDKISTEAESFVARVIKYANENPYMYAMFIVFVGLPLTFIMYFFCKSAPEQPYESNLSRHKKTDKSDLNEDDAVADDADAVAAAADTAEAAKSGYALRNRKKTAGAGAAATADAGKAAAAAEEPVEDDALPSESDSASNVEDEEESNNESAEDSPLPELIDANDETAAAKPTTPKPKAESVADNTRKRRQRKE